ncbi:hypothetical protein CRYUN_Cryun37aG0007000 [Craigia yunnanensis]
MPTTAHESFKLAKAHESVERAKARESVEQAKARDRLSEQRHQLLTPIQIPYYKSIFTPYDAQPSLPQTYGGQHTILQLMGIQQAGVSFPSDAVEGPVFVNAKQYHGILRRRQSRAKAESVNKVVKSRKSNLNESRHLHALRRARGFESQFLNLMKTNRMMQHQPENIAFTPATVSALLHSSSVLTTP